MSASPPTLRRNLQRSNKLCSPPSSSPSRPTPAGTPLPPPRPPLRPRPPRLLRPWPSLPGRCPCWWTTWPVSPPLLLPQETKSHPLCPPTPSSLPSPLPNPATAPATQPCSVSPPPLLPSPFRRLSSSGIWWIQVGLGGSRWIQVGLGGLRWAQVDPGGLRWVLVGPGELQVDSGGIRWVWVGPGGLQVGWVLRSVSPQAPAGTLLLLLRFPGSGLMWVSSRGSGVGPTVGFFLCELQC